MLKRLSRWTGHILGIGCILVSSTFALAATPSEASAPNSLAPRVFDRVRAMPRKMLVRQGRAELSVHGALGIGDAYYHITGGSADLSFYPLETWGISLSGVVMGVPEPSTNLSLVREGFFAQPAEYEPLQRGVFGGLIWVPVEGKLSVMDQSILYFDTFVSMGGGVVWNSADVLQPALSALIGQHFVVSDWLNVKVQLRDVIYMDRYTFMGEERDALRNYLMVELGFGLFVPPSR